MGTKTKQRTDLLFFWGKLLALAALVGLTALMLHLQTTKDVPVSEIQTEMGDLLSALEEGDANTLKRLYALDGSAYDGWFLYTSGSMMDVTELLVVKVSDPDQLSEVEDAVNQRLDQQKHSFDGYGTNQMDLLNHASQQEKGSYYFFGVSKEIDQWEEAFLSCIS